LPHDYYFFISSLLIKDSLTTSVVQKAFHIEKIQHTRHCGNFLAYAQASITTATPLLEQCTFCGMMKHTLLQCYKFQKVQKRAKKEVVQRHSKSKHTKVSDSEETAQIAANASSHLITLQTPVTDFK
jgi:hypothetical protein